MDIRRGSKQTEAGVIPEDWSVSTLGETCTFENGDRGKNYPSASSVLTDGYPFVNAGHVTEGRIKLSELNYISKEVFDRLGGGKFVLGDILFCLRGSLGKFGVVGPDVGRGAIASSLVIVRTIPALMERDYLSCYFGSAYCVQMIEKWSGGAAQPNLGAQDLARFSIFLPPTKVEQRAIADALNDATALIEALKQLLVKKRHIKQGAMQELLTGKGRLPGFEEGTGFKQTEVGTIPGAWDVQPLEALISALEAGVSVNSVERERFGSAHDKSILKTSCVFGGEFIPGERKTIVANDINRAKLNPRRDSIIISRMNTPDLVGECGYVDQDWPNLFLPDRLWMTRHDGRPSHCVRWLAYLLSFSLFNRAIKGTATGTSGSMKNISKSSLLAVRIPVPTKAEQEAIANILFDLDKEIAALEAKLAKARQIKQGMMQELLTGRIRLV